MPYDDNGNLTLRKWNATHIDEHIPLLTGYHENELFYNCTIDSMRGGVFVHCCFTECKFNFQSIEDMQDVVGGFDCAMFSNVELSDKAFDYFALLLLRTKGNTKKRIKIIEALGGKEQVDKLLNAAYPGNNWWER